MVWLEISAAALIASGSADVPVPCSYTLGRWEGVRAYGSPAESVIFSHGRRDPFWYFRPIAEISDSKPPEKVFAEYRLGTPPPAKPSLHDVISQWTIASQWKLREYGHVKLLSLADRVKLMDEVTDGILDEWESGTREYHWTRSRTIKLYSRQLTLGRISLQNIEDELYRKLRLSNPQGFPLVQM